MFSQRSNSRFSLFFVEYPAILYLIIAKKRKERHGDTDIIRPKAFTDRRLAWRENGGGSLMVESRCGVLCSRCERKEQVDCRGCLNMEQPFWGGDCPVKTCCERRGFAHCGKCPDFPCQTLRHMGAEEGFDPAAKIDQCRLWAEGR